MASKTRRTKKEVLAAAKLAAKVPKAGRGKESEPHKVSEPVYEEECQRCGAVGEDRRTLWMSCFYAMEELDMPFEQLRVIGETYELTGHKDWSMHPDDNRYPKISIPQYAESPKSTLDRAFYLLRVCKDCRSDWMHAIKDWFGAPVEKEYVGSGIFVREFGKNVEITQEEWERRRNNK